MLELVKRGTVAGMIAGLAVAVVVFGYDLLHLDPLATPELLSRNLLGGAAPDGSGSGTLGWVADTLVSVREISVYTVVHLAVFAGIGVFGAWVFGPGGVAANVLTGGLFGALAGMSAFYIGIGLVGPESITLPDWKLVLAVNAFAGVVLVSQLVEAPEPDPGAVAPPR